MTSNPSRIRRGAPVKLDSPRKTLYSASDARTCSVSVKRPSPLPYRCSARIMYTQLGLADSPPWLTQEPHPPAEAPPIVYPAAVVDGPNREAAGRFLAYLRSADARAVFEAEGFGVVGRQ